jgi:hypothetical protein
MLWSLKAFFYFCNRVVFFLLFYHSELKSGIHSTYILQYFSGPGNWHMCEDFGSLIRIGVFLQDFNLMAGAAFAPFW